MGSPHFLCKNTNAILQKQKSHTSVGPCAGGAARPIGAAGTDGHMGRQQSTLDMKSWGYNLHLRNRNRTFTGPCAGGAAEPTHGHTAVHAFSVNNDFFFTVCNLTVEKQRPHLCRALCRRCSRANRAYSWACLVSIPTTTTTSIRLDLASQHRHLIEQARWKEDEKVEQSLR